MLAPINKPTGDGRRIAPGGYTNRPLPLPLMWQRQDRNGHEEAVVVGVIDQMNIDEELGEVWGEGELFDDANPTTTPQLAEDAQTARTLIERKAIGPSVDPGSAQATAVMTGMDRAPTMAEIKRFCDQHDGNMPPTEMLFTGYEIAGATLVPIPAFAEARPMELLSAGAALTASKVRTGGWSGLPIAPRDHPWDADAARARLAEYCGLDGDSPDWDCYASNFLYEYIDRDPNTREAYAFPIVDVVDGERTLIPAAIYAAANILGGGRGGTDIHAEGQKQMRGVVAGLYKRLAKEFDDDSIQAPWAGTMSALLAAAQLPPLDGSLFLDPQLDRITPLTREPMGNGWTRVYGHIATHDVCHVGMRGVCTTAPFSDRDYQDFHRYHRTRDGIELPLAVGRLTAAHGQMSATCRCCPGNDDHCCNNTGFGTAVAHHDRMRVLAYGRVGEDERHNAIWFAGVEAPEADERDVALLGRRKVSGDWREIAGNMELTEILVLSRREPGFPLPRVSVENGRQRSLTAASPVGAIVEREDGQMDVIDTTKLGEAIADAFAQALEGFAYNPNQKRGPDGKWISMGGKGSAGGSPKLPGRKSGSTRSSEGGGTGAGGRDSGGTPGPRGGGPYEAGDKIVFQGPGGPRIAGEVISVQDLVMGGPDATSIRWRDDADGGVHTHDAADPRIAKISDNAPSPAAPAGPSVAQRQRAAYNADVMLEARATQDENEDDPDNELEGQMELVQELTTAHGAGSPEANAAVDHLRGMLLASYLDSEDLPEFDPDDFPGITAAAQTHTGAMVALRMSEADAARLAATDGEPPEQLHLTLAYLGDADKIPPGVREKIAEKMNRVAGSYKKPLAGDGFAIDVFNPGTTNDRDTAIVMGVGGQSMADVHGAVMAGLGEVDGLEMPEQHTPHVPHISLQYTDDLNRVKALSDRVGPVTFDRLRLAYGGEVTDIPIGAIIADDEEEQEERDSAMYAQRAQAARLALRATLATAALAGRGIQAK